MSEVLRVVLEELRAIKPALEPSPDMRLREDAGLDSLDALELVASVEQRFRVPVPDEDWRQMRTPQDIAAYVEAALDAPNG